MKISLDYEIIELFDFGYSVEEIAQKLKCPIKTVKRTVEEIDNSEYKVKLKKGKFSKWN